MTFVISYLTYFIQYDNPQVHPIAENGIILFSFSQLSNIPLEKEMANHSIFLPEKSHRQRSLVGYCPWGRKELGTTQWLNNNNS